MSLDEDALDTLSCDIAARPKDAPSLTDVLPAIRSFRREAGALVVEFDSAAAEALTAAVAAERLCCAGIGWELEREPVLRLRIVATPPQLDVFAGFLAP